MLLVDYDLVCVSVMSESDGGFVDECCSQHGSSDNSISDCFNENSITLFDAFQNYFNFFHVNIQAILDSTHFEGLKMVLAKSTNVFVCAISKTFLRRFHTNKSIAIDNFKIIQSARSSRFLAPSNRGW